jgi:hypothetical protein
MEWIKDLDWMFRTWLVGLGNTSTCVVVVSPMPSTNSQFPLLSYFVTVRHLCHSCYSALSFLHQMCCLIQLWWYLLFVRKVQREESKKTVWKNFLSIKKRLLYSQAFCFLQKGCTKKENIFFYFKSYSSLSTCIRRVFTSM